MDRAIFHIDGCYNIPNFRVVGVPCRTCQAPHTAFRGFGGPQGMVVMEHIMDHLAVASGVSGVQVRQSSMYQTGDVTPFGMRLGDSGPWNVPYMWERVLRQSKMAMRREEVAKFNAESKWLKRGLAIVPTKFGIAFTAKFMNQG